VPESFARRAAIVARWPLGIGLTSWRYMWRVTPLERAETTETEQECRAGIPPLEEKNLLDGVQGTERGVGPLYHRRYRTRIKGAQLSPESLIERISGDPNVVAPTEFARFIRTRGHEGHMGVGDEFVVRMPGPWDGPVRVVDKTPTSFRLATLDGHLEAGQIEFRAFEEDEEDEKEEEDNGLVFEIESWARSGDRLSSLLYNKLRMAKEIQLHMWTSVLERATSLAGGRRMGRISISTHREPSAG
jgi:hypothetical protein